MNYALSALCLTGLMTVQATGVSAAANDDEAPAVQVYLGVLQLQDQSGSWDELSDTGVDIDFTDMPIAGVEVEYVYEKGWIHWGLNPGGSIAWKSDGTEFSGTLTQTGGVTVEASLDNSMLLMEMHLGGYVRGRLNDKMTAYAAAGPMLMYGSHDVEDQTLKPAGSDDTLVVSNSDSSAYGLGYYARAGIDFSIRDRDHLGVGIRYQSAELDFDKTVGNIDIEGPQFVLTYSRNL